MRSASRVAALLLLAAPAAADLDPCRAEVRLEPGEAVVGQQVLYGLRISSRLDVEQVEWLEPPSFPGFRAERLPGAPQAPASGRRRLREEQRALFPEVAGELVVPGASLRCVAADGSEWIARVPQASLSVRPLPPDHPQVDLVGPLSLRVRADREELRLGESLRLEVSLRGAGNLWQAPDPFPDDAAFGGAELFRSRPQLALEPGTRLLVKRDFVYDVVPRRAGALGIPPIEIDYFDPETARFARARAPGFEIAVADRDPTAPGAAGGVPAEVRDAREGRWRGWVLVGVPLAAIGLALARRRRSAAAPRG